MKKRLFALLLVICFAFSATVYADYYPEAERSEVTFEEMLKDDIALENVLKELEEAKERLQKRDNPISVFVKINNALNIMYADIDMITKANLLYIQSAIDNSEENNEKYLKCTDYIISINQVYSEVLKGVFEDPNYREPFMEIFNIPEDEFKELIDSFPSDKEFELEKELNVLTEEFYNNQFGKLVVKKNGKEYNYQDMRSNAGEFSLSEVLEYYKQSADILVPLFIDMVEIRNDIAVEAGYEDFSEYAYNEQYPKDYTDDDRKALAEYTIEYIIPLYNSLEDIYIDVYYDSEMEEPDYTEEEALSKVRETLDNINPELTEAFDYMIKFELYDVGFSDKKKSGAFTTKLDYYSVPFLFVNPDNSVSNMINSVVHEFGHYNADFHAPETINDEYEPDYEGGSNLDVSEIHSQGMEMLFMDELGRFYGSDAATMRVENLMYVLQSVVQGVLYDTWLERVYTLDEKELNAKNINGLFKECCEEFGMKDVLMYPGSEGWEWIQVNHNFEVPFYYISYAVSAVAALELFSDAEVDRAAAIDKYMTLTTKGSEVNFKSTLKDCGFTDIFTKNAYIDIAKAVKDYTGLGFEDLKDEEWYYPYVIRISNFVDPIAEGKYGPSDNATRLMFVETLGRMEEDVNGMEAYESPFTDTESPYVAWAAKNGIVAGIGNDKFGAEQTVTREQILSFLYRMAGEPKVEGTIKFEDSKDISEWAKNAVLWAQEEGIASGYTDNTIRPKNNITRAEAAKFLADAYETYY